MMVVGTMILAPYTVSEPSKWQWTPVSGSPPAQVSQPAGRTLSSEVSVVKGTCQLGDKPAKVILVPLGGLDSSF